jgi:hypothetical protein
MSVSVELDNQVFSQALERNSDVVPMIVVRAINFELISPTINIFEVDTSMSISITNVGVK